MSRCVVCGTELPKGSRADRRTCSARCRVALSRRLTHTPQPSKTWLEAGAANICECAYRVIPKAGGGWRHDPRDR